MNPNLASSSRRLPLAGRMLPTHAVSVLVPALLLCLGPLVSTPVRAQEESAAPATEANPNEPEKPELVSVQGQIADRYAQLEQLLIRRAELEATSNPQRAALLKQAVRESANRSTRRQLQEIVQLLKQQQLRDAVDRQESVHADLQALLKLLLTEDRADRLKGEQQRIKEYIKEVERLQRLQGSTRARTEGSDEPQKLSGEQEQIADRAGNLADQIRENEEGKPSQDDAADEPGGEDSDRQQPGGEGDPADEKQPGDGKAEGDESKGSKPGRPDDDQKPSEEEMPPDDDSPPGDPRDGKPQQDPSEQGPSQQGQPQQGQPQQGQPQQGEQPPAGEIEPENPARQRIQAAEDRMRAAQERLEQSKKEEAVDEQLAAEEELRKAKAELEEILRQLREEEVERMLALLEGRFRKMLEMQLKVYEATIQLDKTPAEERGREIDIQASRLSVDERKIMLEADRALTLLLEEGSSVSFPEVVREMRDNMQQVVDRLARGMVDTLTQATEEDIIESLEEMIVALEKAQKDMEQQQQQQQPSGPMQMVEPPLVDQLTELKMIRALQMRVNKRTERFAALLDSPDDVKGQATDAELRGALRTLSEREDRIHQITRDIVLGKNR